MYKEVEINTPLELARYLVNEGDLYVDEDKPRLTAEAAEDTGEGNPFRCYYSNGKFDRILGYWDAVDYTYYKKLNWYDCIPEGKKVPCYVSNINVTPDGSDSVTYITHCDPALECAYLMINGDRVKYATPIPAAELWVPEL